MESKPLTDDALPDDLAERISARRDGELSPAEAAEVDRLLADNPAARRFAEDLRELSRLCQASPAPVAGPDLSKSILAEALRRQAVAEENRPQPADRLEPEGDFGLPFGKSSQNWAWAGVAAAAAVVMFLGGRGDQPGPGPTVAVQRQQMEQRLALMQQVAPRMQVKNYEVTPDRLQRLRQVLAQRAARSTQPSGELMTVSRQAGVAFRPANPTELGANGVTEEVLCVDADEAELDRLLAELDREPGNSVTPVEPGSPTQSTAPPAKPTIGGLWRVQAAGDGAAAIPPKVSPVAGRRFIVLRIRVVPKP